MDTGELILVPLSLTSIRWISKCICPNCKIYLSKFKHVFVQISECICPNSNMYLSIYNWGHGHWGAHICSTLSFLLHLLNINNIKLLLLFLLSIYKMYLSKFLNVFVQISIIWSNRMDNYICQNCWIKKEVGGICWGRTRSNGGIR